MPFTYRAPGYKTPGYVPTKIKQYTCAQAARFLGVPYQTVRYRIRQGKMFAVRTPFGPLIGHAELLRYRRERRARGLEE